MQNTYKTLLILYCNFIKISLLITAYTTQPIQLETSPATTLGDFQTLTAQNSSQSTSKTNLIHFSSTEKTNYFTTLSKSKTNSSILVTTKEVPEFFDLNTTSIVYNESVRLIMTLAALAEFFDGKLSKKIKK